MKTSVTIKYFSGSQFDLSTNGKASIDLELNGDLIVIIEDFNHNIEDPQVFVFPHHNWCSYFVVKIDS